MVTLLNLVEAVQDNNRVNDGSWKDWTDLSHIEEVYGSLDDEDVTREEVDRVIAAAIASNGASLRDDLSAIERRIEGQNFAGSRWDRAATPISKARF